MRRKLKTLLQHPSGFVGFVLLAAILIMAASAGTLYPEGPWPMDGTPTLWPGEEPAYLLGTDAMGRDLLAGLLYGARVSLAIGLAATAVALLVGVTVGAFAGYHGGLIDDALMRFTDAMQTIPSFLFAVVIVGVLTPSLLTIICSIALVSWPTVARLVRAEFLRLRSMDFVLACRTMGMSDVRIIFRQILPNCVAPIIVASSVLVATAIIIEASLSFLGLGDPNAMSWGTMIGAARPSLRTAWYMTLVPAAAVVATVLALNLIGDALNDAFNPRRRER
ncbi:ABC transporter permease [Bosea sp. (in: a-proteobacteria)]|uniref:ABC transporter permease n=1 Tax=Bosea sp. (in: a-proteobacteria) TaxID=1871050 RepID=UPI0033404462